eukprot:4708548-Amphidinium_carterae.1
MEEWQPQTMADSGAKCTIRKQTPFWVAPGSGHRRHGQAAVNSTASGMLKAKRASKGKVK